MGKKNEKRIKSKHNINSNIKTREDLLTIVKNNEINDKLINDSLTIPEHIGLYTNVVTNFPNIDVEDPIYIRLNLSLMKLRLSCYKKALELTILSNQDSITDTTVNILKTNLYIEYLETVINHFDK